MGQFGEAGAIIPVVVAEERGAQEVVPVHFEAEAAVGSEAAPGRRRSPDGDLPEPVGGSFVGGSDAEVDATADDQLQALPCAVVARCEGLVLNLDHVGGQVSDLVEPGHAGIVAHLGENFDKNPTIGSGLQPRPSYGEVEASESAATLVGQISPMFKSRERLSAR